MPVPTFSVSSRPAQASVQALSRSQAASRLSVSMGSLDKLISAGMLGEPPIHLEPVERLQAMKTLEVASGELTVLRTAPRAACVFPNEGRDWIGFHVEMSDDEVSRASLRYWRSDPEKVLDNVLFAVTVATFPVAVFQITEHVDTIVREDEKKARPRHGYGGVLLARRGRGGQIVSNDGTSADLIERALQVMGSRVIADSGGPIAYLGPKA